MLRFGIIGDFNPENQGHIATNKALEHAGPCSIEWLATDHPHDYDSFDGLICSPGSPYKSETGALEALRHARENRVPLLGTCGGFQHIVLEFARNVAGVVDAGHAENDPNASVMFINRLACSLVGTTMSVAVERGTLASVLYGSDTAEEQYYCNFGLNAEYLPVLLDAGLRVSGVDSASEVRIVELPGHPFYIGTLFVPQMRSTLERPHPLIVGLYKAAASRA